MLLYKSLRVLPIQTSPRRQYSSAQLNLYQVLELLPRASLKEIKVQFQKLLKKYHPDLNAHLSDKDKEANNKKYVEMVLAYDTLKDKARRRSYDATLMSGSHGQSSVNSGRSTPSEWENEYYGEAKHYSRARASGSYTSHGYNYTRHRVHNFYRGQEPPSGGHFTGEHRNRGDRFDVPHFDYNEHLSKNLKFEQRIISKNLTKDEKEAVLRQLAPDGDLSKVNEELITKHLMRQAKGESFVKTESPKYQPTSSSHNPYMYHGPQNGHSDVSESSVGFKAFMVAGGAGFVYLLYHMILG